MADSAGGGNGRFCPQAVCRMLHGSLAQLLGREWLLTNGLGGYAASTVIGCPTRRYHGLLVSARRPPVGRSVLLAAALERLTIDQETVELANFEFNDALHPRGYLYLKDFDYDLHRPRPFVQFIYQIGQIEIRKRISMVHGHDLVILDYDVSMPPQQTIEFDLLPLVTARDFHNLRRRSATDPFVIESDERCGLWLAETSDQDLSLAGLPTAAGGAELVRYDRAPDWWYDFRYRAEAERGMDCGEDLFAPGWWRCRLRGDGKLSWVFVAGSTGMDDARSLAAAALDTSRRPRGADRPDADLLVGELHRAADQFVVRRRISGGKSSTTILAGYHWFGDWGRDTFIALPGLLLLTGRNEQAKEVLSTFAEVQADGLIPNRFTDDGAGCDYNSVDASLWFVHAADAYLQATGDEATWNQTLLPACKQVVEACIPGTRYAIAVDADGLLRCGDATTQLTWMDAKQGEAVFTPRHGKPVEIQALWYRALCIVARRCRQSDQGMSARCEQLAQRTRENFGKSFWNHQLNCLYDCLGPDGPDPAIRPNQIFAVSLPDSPLPRAKQRLVVDCVATHLLTPMGLRTLSPESSGYRGRYVGNAFNRDAAYHQGTVWGWLIGPFVEAYLRAHDFAGDARDHCADLIRPLCDHLGQAGLGSVSEIFDGAPPHTPRGCVAQAWSVAELLRAHHLIHAHTPVLAAD